MVPAVLLRCRIPPAPGRQAPTRPAGYFLESSSDSLPSPAPRVLLHLRGVTGQVKARRPKEGRRGRLGTMGRPRPGMLPGVAGYGQAAGPRAVQWFRTLPTAERRDQVARTWIGRRRRRRTASPQGWTRSGSAWCATRLAEWRQLSDLRAAAALPDPLRDQRLVGASHRAQFGHGLPSGLVLRGPCGRPSRARARRLRPADRHGSLRSRSTQPLRRLYRLRSGRPPGMAEGNARQASAEQPAAAGPGMIVSHLARTEHVSGKSKLSVFVSAC